MATHSRSSHTPEQWEKIINDCLKNGLSEAALGKQKELTPADFVPYKKRGMHSDSVQPQSKEDTAEQIATTLEMSADSKDNSDDFLQDNFVPLSIDPASLNNASPTNQKIEVVFAQGHRLCLDGPFDLELLGAWLTPLLTTQDNA